jgi:hypothetical protein
MNTISLFKFLCPWRGPQPYRDRFGTRLSVYRDHLAGRFRECTLELAQTNIAAPLSALVGRETAQYSVSYRDSCGCSLIILSSERCLLVSARNVSSWTVGFVFLAVTSKSQFGEGKRFNHTMVAKIRSNYGLETRYSRLRARGMLILGNRQAA